MKEFVGKWKMGVGSILSRKWEHVMLVSGGFVEKLNRNFLSNRFYWCHGYFGIRSRAELGLLLEILEQERQILLDTGEDTRGGGYFVETGAQLLLLQKLDMFVEPFSYVIIFMVNIVFESFILQLWQQRIQGASQVI